MFGKNIRCSELETRKKLLLLESELNRVLLLEEVAEVKNEARQIAGRIASTGPLTMFAVQAGSSLTGLFDRIFHRGRGGEKRKSSRFFSLLRSLRAGIMLWSEFRAHFR